MNILNRLCPNRFSIDAFQVSSSNKQLPLIRPSTRLCKRSTMDPVEPSSGAADALPVVDEKKKPTTVDESKPICIGCGKKNTFDEKYGFCGRFCRDKWGPICMRRKCGKPTFDKRPGGYCNHFHRKECTGDPKKP